MLKFISFVLLTFLLLQRNFGAGEVDSDEEFDRHRGGKGHREQRRRCCSNAVPGTNLTSGGSFAISSPNNPLPYGTQVNSIKWKFRCETSKFSVACSSFDVQSTPDCIDDSLQIQTCTGTRQRFCGSIFATQAYSVSTLCLSFANKLNVTATNTGFTCSVTCSP